MNKDKLYKPTQAAKLLDISKSTLLRWEKEGLIKPAKRNYQNYRVYTIKNIEEIKREMGLDILKEPGEDER